MKYFFIFFIIYAFINAMEEQKEKITFDYILNRFDNNISLDHFTQYCQYRKVYLENEKNNSDKKVLEELIKKCPNANNINFNTTCRDVLNNASRFNIILLILIYINYFNYYNMESFIPWCFAQKDSIFKNTAIVCIFMYLIHRTKSYFNNEINIASQNDYFKILMQKIEALKNQETNLIKFQDIKNKFNKIDIHILNIINDIVDAINGSGSDDIRLYTNYIVNGSSFKEVGNDDHKKYLFYYALKKLFEYLDEGIDILENIKKTLNIIDFIPIVYNVKNNIKKVKLYGYDSIIEKESSIIINYFSSDYNKREDLPCPNFVFYGEGGCGKTELIKNIIHKIVESRDILLFKIEIGNLQKPQDLVFLQNTVELYLKKGNKIIIYIDELDGILQDRGNLALTFDAYGLIAQFLQFIDRIKHKDCVVLAATNYIEKIDKQAMRAGRFNGYPLLLPNADQRYKIVSSIMNENENFFNELVDADVQDKNLLAKAGAMAGKFMAKIPESSVNKKKKEILDRFTYFMSYMAYGQSCAEIAEFTKFFVHYNKENKDGKKKTFDERAHDFLDRFFKLFLEENGIDPSGLISYCESMEAKFFEKCNKDIDKNPLFRNKICPEGEAAGLKKLKINIPIRELNLFK